MRTCPESCLVVLNPLGIPLRFSFGFSLEFHWDFPGISGPGFDRIDGTGALQGPHSGAGEPLASRLAISWQSLAPHCGRRLIEVIIPSF
jgi:hypothetical protein